jgi:hypothetical protein
MNDALYVGAFGVVATAYGLWIYRSPSAERFYTVRPYLLATTGWILTGVIPIGLGAVIIAVAMLFGTGSFVAQVLTAIGLASWILGFGLILIHPNRIRPKWLRGQIGD